MAWAIHGNCVGGAPSHNRHTQCDGAITLFYLFFIYVGISLMTTVNRCNNAHNIARLLAPILCKQVLYKDYKQIIKKIEFIHSGKYGTVSLVQLRGTRNDLAIKTIHISDHNHKLRDWVYSRDLQKAFSIWSETVICEALSNVVMRHCHPGFAIMYGWIHTVKDDYINHFRLCMEVSNGSLKDWNTQYADPSVDMAYSLIIQTLTALIVMGSLGISHNDLYDRNILFENTNEQALHFKSVGGLDIKVKTCGTLFKIVDFGMASAPMAGATDFMPDLDDDTFMADKITHPPARHIVFAVNIQPAARDLLTLLWLFMDMAATWPTPVGYILKRYIDKALSYISVCIGHYGEKFSLQHRNIVIKELLSPNFLKLWPASVRHMPNGLIPPVYDLDGANMVDIEAVS